ncbi:MAG: C15orf41 family protein [Candidatus Thermoplasmatota archaeon]|nr:C15orf41 family protein [Candidatus Thermoplasmatota archaeon]
MMLDRDTYEEIYRQLNDHEDIERLSRKYRKMDKELFLVLYTQKMSRKVIENYHRIKNKASWYSKQWRSGQSFIEISKKIDFPPVMTAFIILTDQGTGKRTFRKMLNDPNSIQDRRLKIEIAEARAADPIYSPEGSQVQTMRGIWGEDIMRKWLDERGLRYKREEDLRGEGRKTPDFLMEYPLFYRGEEVNWIESKASFGDEREVRKNINKQLIHYRNIFGPGMVIYWFGMIDNLPIVDGIQIQSSEVLQDRWDLS